MAAGQQSLTLSLQLPLPLPSRRHHHRHVIRKCCCCCCQASTLHALLLSLTNIGRCAVETQRLLSSTPQPLKHCTTNVLLYLFSSSTVLLPLYCFNLQPHNPYTLPLLFTAPICCRCTDVLPLLPRCDWPPI